ncbi:MAG: UTP--glucose-1-phosphate uridylyltransferase [Candidatus Nealsonbacteria bacterium]|nr:UTP--glucose-1-phosphate uridylyltransferase [Candidatus Nealsonbacteria bacterium]
MIQKAIVLTAGLGTRFLPLSKVLPKEFWPLAAKPMIQYIVEEAVNSGINHIIFVVRPGQSMVFDYFKKPVKELEQILKERNNEASLERLLQFEDTFRGVSFSFVIEKEPLGDGHAILKAKKLIGNEPFAVLFDDDIVESKTPCSRQLISVFKTCQKPVLSLHRISKERFSFYGIVGVEKIASRLFKMKKIVEKPPQEEAPSDLAVVGKYILTPEIFSYLQKLTPNSRGEIILADALSKMINDGKLVYGYELEGEWWECGNPQAYLETNFHFSLKHPEYGPKLKEFLKNYK